MSTPALAGASSHERLFRHGIPGGNIDRISGLLDTNPTSFWRHARYGWPRNYQKFGLAVLGVDGRLALDRDCPATDVDTGLAETVIDSVLSAIGKPLRTDG
jgi:hypothetical protein